MTARPEPNAGPPFAICARARQGGHFDADQATGHWQIVRTGRTRKAPRGKTGRWYGKMDLSHEYRCVCGHRGWSTHPGVLDYPLDHVTAEDVGNGSDCPVHPEKQQYATKADAREFAPVPGCAQYLCGFCGCWHNGNPTPRTNKKREARGR